MSKKDNIVNIVLTGDEKYVLPIGVAMFSIVKNLSHNRIANFFLIVSGWGEQEEKEIRKLLNCNITILHVEKYLYYFSNADSKEFKNSYIQSLSPYYRLLIPQILPEYIDKVIYFDADMVTDNDLSIIYDSLTEDKLCAAVAELFANKYYDTTLKHLSEWNEFDKFNSDRFKYPYFNAGFFVLNLKLSRKLNLFNEFLNFLQKHPNPPYADQDTLNAVCGQKYSDKMMYLPLNWNVFTDIIYSSDLFFDTNLFSYWQIQSAFQKPYVYHYAGPNKPWVNKMVRHYYNVWFNYYNLSPYKKDYDLLDNINSQTIWIKILNIPIIKIKKSIPNQTMKAYLLGFIPIFRSYPNLLKIYFLGILILKIIYVEKLYFKLYLFNCILLCDCQY